MKTTALLRGLGNLLFVPCCPACDARAPEVGWSAGLCPVCSESLYELGPACPRCAEPMAGPRSIECRRCRRTPPPFAFVRAPYRYGGELAVALRRLKYDRRPDIARALAPLVGPALREASEHADVAVPVPLYWRRLARRTFNQAALLLRHGGRDLDIPIDQLSLRRVREARPQSSASAAQRASNVAGAFAVPRGRRSCIEGKRVLLCDDIMTTGATLREATRALRRAGAASVVGFCVARAES